MRETQTYSSVHAVYMSFFSKKLYRDIAKNWAGTGFGYLFALVAVCLLPEALVFNKSVGDFLSAEAPKIARQVPEIKISRGTLSVDAEEPYVIKDPDTGKPLAIIDTEGKADSLLKSDARLLLNKNDLVIKEGDSSIRSLSLSEIDNVRINRTVVYEWIDMMEENFIFVFYPLAAAFSFAYKAIEILLFGLAGLAASRLLRAPLSYKICVRLAAVSATPGMLLILCVFVAGVKIPYLHFAGFLVSLFYLLFAVKAVTADESAEG